ncbi:unnamed protein product [Adineta ricciae]|uniref:Mab-21-like HhH/H2TH-like domain-containing protein n=1 Tax=Adineta ricciae TaxID=249248 RepID=A0A815K4E2_ADIRI|nr:unnamed protein product [Adineta ricciae]
MGNKSIKSSKNKLTHPTKHSRHLTCCGGINSSASVSSCSTDEKYYYPTFDRIRTNNAQKTSSGQSVNDLQRKIQNTISINQWIDSLPNLDTRTVCQLADKQVKCQFDDEDDIEQLECIFKIHSNREFAHLTKKFHLKFYLKDFQTRLKSSSVKRTFQGHFSSTKIIFPSNDTYQNTINDFNLIFTSPSESILPILSFNATNCHQIHEQLRSKCYFLPLVTHQIEPNDDEYKQRSFPLDRTHVVITLENNQTTRTSKTTSPEIDSLLIFTSDDFFQTGLIRINPQTIAKELSAFVYVCKDDNVSYLSSSFIQQWFNTLILVNQTCAIVKRFLLGNTNHVTCLFKESMQHTDKTFSSQSNLIFASFRLSSRASSTQSLVFNGIDDKSEHLTDAFSPRFLSNSTKTSKNTIHVDYEQYSCAFLLLRWPKHLVETYYTDPIRNAQRQWPSQAQMEVLINRPLLLTPTGSDHAWKINFDLIEENLWEFMNEFALYVYILCQQLFALTYNKRCLIKHTFFNYCEKYGLPFSNNENNLSNIITSFLKELSEQIKQKSLPNYFNHEINMFDPTEDYAQWFDHIDQCLVNRIYLTISSTVSPSNRPIVIEFFFRFTDRLYRTFHQKQSEFHLNETSLLNLHQQLCDDLSISNNQLRIETIRMHLTQEFDTNAELVHNYLNQIRKTQTSLVFHYIWTIYMQYLHTYYNVLWHMEEFERIR